MLSTFSGYFIHNLTMITKFRLFWSITTLLINDGNKSAFDDVLDLLILKKGIHGNNIRSCDVDGCGCVGDSCGGDGCGCARGGYGVGEDCGDGDADGKDGVCVATDFAELELDNDDESSSMFSVTMLALSSSTSAASATFWPSSISTSAAT
ncbi:hypothetical protein DERF_001784 [Dermatophagoides farinae]|uniref:Uncharacterized protein n=1 Tax=Dermatophagoides farinae TaxID=6954 RepID=A0A922LBG3_DERFA|nr:hypothetical protein DERF_001784 [Dermatophagoides farinae]